MDLVAVFKTEPEWVSSHLSSLINRIELDAFIVIIKRSEGHSCSL